MKKGMVIGIIVIFLIIITVILCGVFNKNKVEIKKINHFSFSYSTSNMMYGYVSYKCDYQDDKYYVEIKPNNLPDEEALKKEVDNQLEKEIEQILVDYQVSQWDGFQKSDLNVLDGSSFSLSISMEEDNDISASGYMMWPKNYREVRDKFDNLFMTIYNDNVK